jgi:predicted nucleic acid-binding protein
LIVVDASLFAAWLLNESGHGPTDDVWDKLTAETLLVPSHWPNEIANALRRAVRTKRLHTDEVRPVAERINVFDVSVMPPIAIEEIGGLAFEALANELSTYDMLYVRLARDRQVPLATVDRGMRAAAQRLKISLLPA